MRKFLKKIFWSHGTPLGYLGSLSQKGPPEIFLKWVLFNLSNPLRHPAPLVDPLLTKNLDTAGPWCAHVKFKWNPQPQPTVNNQRRHVFVTTYLFEILLNHSKFIFHPLNTQKEFGRVHLFEFSHEEVMN